MDVLTTADEAMRGREEFFWADLCDPSQEDLDALAPMLGLHRLALEDTQEFGQPPKLDHYGDHVLLVFYSARECDASTAMLFEPFEVHVYIAGGFVLTVRRGGFAPLERLHDRFEEQMSEEAVVYEILDTLTDELVNTSNRIETRIDALEAAVLERVEREHSSRIYRLKQEVRDLQRRAVTQHGRFESDMTAILGLPGFEPGQRRYLNDVRDHLEEAAEALTRQLEDLQALTGTFFNANAQRLNSVVARLSVLATFFFVWTLVTSFFGQNFGWLVDSIDSRGDFLLWGVGGLAVSSALTAALLYWRRRDFF